MPAYDEELWAFMDQASGRNLINLTETGLQERLTQIDKNILYLDSGRTPRDGLSADRGWLSPWWWLRARYWTILEFERRELTPLATVGIPAIPTLAEGFHGTMAGGRKLLARISRRTATRHAGRPFAVYTSGSIAVCRRRRTRRRGAEKTHKTRASYSHQRSERKHSHSIGDVTFAVPCVGAMECEDLLVRSFSGDLDPRLSKARLGCLHHHFDQWNLFAVATASESQHRGWPRAFPNGIDPHFLGGHKLRSLISKEMAFAYQREMRLVLDPEDGPPLADGDFFVEVGPLADIAAVYAPTGERISGTGPDNFLHESVG
jgi:hypothetical protein